MATVSRLNRKPWCGFIVAVDPQDMRERTLGSDRPSQVSAKTRGNPASHHSLSLPENSDSTDCSGVRYLKSADETASLAPFKHQSMPADAFVLRINPWVNLGGFEMLGTRLPHEPVCVSQIIWTQRNQECNRIPIINAHPCLGLQACNLFWKEQ